MKNEITLHLRAFPVTAHDHRTGQAVHIIVPVTKDQLRAAQVVGESSKELVERLCERQGYSVLEIGKPIKRAATLDLWALFMQGGEAGA